MCRQLSTTKQNVVRLQSVSIKRCLRSRSTQGECIREAENGHFESSFTLLSAMSMASRGSRVNMKLVSCSCGAFFHRTGHKSHSSPPGPPCWELQVSLPLGKDSTVTEERQKTKPGPFSSSAGSWERHRGARLCGATLRRSSRRLKWCGSTGQEEQRNHKRNIVSKRSVFPFFWSRHKALTSFCIHKAVLWKLREA